MGDFVSDLQQRRAIITQTHARGRNTIIEAEAPLATLFGYSRAMRGLSQGRASASLSPAHYGPAPPEVLESVPVAWSSAVKRSGDRLAAGQAGNR